MHRPIEKNRPTQMYTVQSGESQQKGAGYQLRGTRSVIRGSGSQKEVPDLTSSGIPLKFKPWVYNAKGRRFEIRVLVGEKRNSDKQCDGSVNIY